MSLRLDFLKNRLYQCFAEALHYELLYTDSNYDEYNFPPMLFLVTEEWELIGGPLEDNEDPLQLIRIANKSMEFIFRETGVILPYVLMITSGYAQKIDISNNQGESVKGRLFTIASNEFNYSLIQFNRENISFAFNSIVDDTLAEACRGLISRIEEFREQ